MKHNWEYRPFNNVLFPKKEIVRAKSKFGVDDSIDYIDISSIERLTHSIGETSSYIFAEAPSRAQQCVIENDVLVSLVRPNLRNTALIKSNKQNLVASSGFCVLRGKYLAQRFIFHFVNSDKFTNILISQCSGAAYPAVKEEDIRNIIVPVPPMEVQEQIVAELDAINDLIEKNREVLRNLEALAQSLFYDTFGDPITNPKGWEMSPFCKVFKLSSGDGLSAKNIIKGDFPVYGGNGIVGYHNAFNLSGINLIIGRVGALCGNIRLVQGNIFVTDNAFITTILKDMNLIFCERLLQILNLRDFANAAAQPVISNSSLKDISIILPPLSLQETFATQIEAIESQKVKVEAAIAELKTLLDSRMDYWFN